MENAISIIAPIFTLLLGSYLTYLMTTKSKYEEEKLKYKIDKYNDMLIHLKILVGLKNPTKQDIDTLLDKQYQIWLYASDSVVKNIHNLLEFASGDIKDSNRGNELLGNVVISMREDIGVKTKLTNNYFRYRYQIEK